MNAYFSFFESMPRTLALTALLAGAAAGGGCGFGGLNDGIKTSGDQPGGVKIALGDIAVAPDGSYFLFERDDRLAVGWVGSGQVALLPVSSPARLAFSHQRHVVYVTTETGELHAVDVADRDLEWSATTGQTLDPMVVASEDDSRVAVGSALSVVVFDAADGATVASHALERPLVDLEILPDDARLLAVEAHGWPAEAEAPTTVIHVIALGDGAAHAFDVPNCSDDIIVPHHGQMAMLAPTQCNKDPISYIDLTVGEEKFVKNLPGFGPVAMGPDGKTAVGFLDMTQVDGSLFEDESQIPAAEPRFHLMVIDTETLAYEFHPYGADMPRYAMTPDGSVLLVDESFTGNARLFDLGTKQYRAITGGLTLFEQLAFSSDSSHAYVLSEPSHHVSTQSQQAFTDYELFELDIAEAAATKLPTPFRPRNVNMSPDDERLFLRRDATTICVYSLESKTCERNLALASK